MIIKHKGEYSDAHQVTPYSKGIALLIGIFSDKPFLVQDIAIFNSRCYEIWGKCKSKVYIYLQIIESAVAVGR